MMTYLPIILASVFRTKPNGGFALIYQLFIAHVALDFD